LGAAGVPDFGFWLSSGFASRHPRAEISAGVDSCMGTDNEQPDLTPYTSSISGRRDQAFPVVSEAEIARIRRFGEVRQYKRGARLFAAGEPIPGMFVLLNGSMTLSQRDGLGHVSAVVQYRRRGQFTGEVALLSGGH